MKTFSEMNAKNNSKINSKMMANPETVLLFNMNNTEKGKKVKFILVRMGVRIKNITPEMLNQQVGYLSGMKGFEAADGLYDGETFLDEMLVMKGFTSKRVDELLMQFKKAEIEKIQLKAVVTDSNKSWTVLELYKELKKENEEMSKQKASK